MTILIQPTGILRGYERMRATLHSVGTQAAPQQPNGRYLRGTIRLIDLDSFAFITWEWEAVGYPANETYVFAPIIIRQEPGSSNIFSQKKLNELNEDARKKIAEESAALYILDGLICLTTEDRTLIDNTMILPATSAPTIRRGIYRDYKGREYLVEGLAVAAGEEHLPSYAQHWSVLYRPLYDDYSLRTRSYMVFTELINKDGYDGPRFAFVHPA